MTADEHAHMQELEGLVKRYRSRIVALKAALAARERELAGFLSAEIPELQSVEVPRLAEAVDKFAAEALAHQCRGGSAFHADCWSCVSLYD